VPLSVRSRVVTGLLGAAVAAVGFGLAAFQTKEVADRLRADTAVQAQTTGEPDCIVGAAFTTPDGRRQVVDLRRYKGNCLSGQPGQAVTVYYDASDPTVTTETRSVWWPALLVLLSLTFVLLGGPTLLAAVRGVSPRDRRRERHDEAGPPGQAADDGSQPP
jgi:hypothetical protein